MRNKLLILLSIFFLPFIAYGQKLVNSPYSRFNIGTIEPAGSFKSQGMGGVSIGMRDNLNIYFSNPASYSSLDTNSFVFDFGMDYAVNKLSNGSSHYSSDDMNFDHIMLGFPLAKGWGFAAGIIPFSNGYYNLQSIVKSTDPGYDPLTGEYTTTHKGEGGFNNAFAGTGIKLGNFSVGVNMSILFGEVSRSNQFFLNDYYNVYHNSSSERLQVSGLNFDYGLQYSAAIKKDYFFNAGLSFTSAKKYKYSYDQLKTRYTTYSTTDTLSFSSDNSGKLTLPGTMRAGISFGKINKFTAGLDYVETKWSKAKLPGETGYTADSKSFILGLEYTPDKFSNNAFLKRMSYRIGAHTGDSYFIYEGHQLKEKGLSFGIGVPMRRTFSRANLFFDYTKRSGAAPLHTENVFTVGASINIYDFWFVQRKYD
jgi:hypothetical protein